MSIPTFPAETVVRIVSVSLMVASPVIHGAVTQSGDGTATDTLVAVATQHAV